MADDVNMTAEFFSLPTMDAPATTAGVSPDAAPPESAPAATSDSAGDTATVPEPATPPALGSTDTTTGSEAPAGTDAPSATDGAPPVAAPTDTAPAATAIPTMEAPQAQSAPAEVATYEQALREAAAAEGIAETDVLKIPALLRERREAKQAAQQERDQQALEGRFTATAHGEMRNIVQPTVEKLMADEGYDLTAKEWWADPENAVALARYHELETALVDHPDNATTMARLKNGARAEHNLKTQRVTDTVAKYPDAPTQLIKGLSDNGADEKFIEHIAQTTQEQVNKATATINSALAEAQRELTTLRAQATDLAAADKAGYERGKADGIKEALDNQAAGGRAPAPHLNGASMAAQPLVSVGVLPSSLDDIPLA